MPERLIMVTRTDQVGDVDAEPVVVATHPDGSADVRLDDGVVLQLDAACAHDLGFALLGAGSTDVGWSAA